jgi:NTE family protein
LSSRRSGDHAGERGNEAGDAPGPAGLRRSPDFPADLTAVTNGPPGGGRRFAAAGQVPALAALQAFASLRPLFEPLPRPVLDAIEPLLEWYGIPAGTILFREGDPAPDAFIVVAGRLGVFIEPDRLAGSSAGAEPRLVAQIVAGEPVGEMSLVSGEPRSATVIALRDSDLVRLPGEAFTLILQANPEAARFVMQLLTKRLRHTSRTRALSEPVESVALVPIDEALIDPDFASRLAAAFAGLGREAVTIAAAAAEREPDILAAGGDLVLYLADAQFTAWTHHAIRQADRVVFVANAQAGPLTSPSSAIAYAAELHRSADLVLINPADSVLPDGGTRWLADFASERILPVRAGRAADAARVARLILRSALGLVLSGGGARAFAHVGVLRAFAEAGIPIDLVGGTSMGAIVAGLAALELSPDAIAERLRQAFVGMNPLDYTLPIVALARGRRMNQLLRENFGEARVENLWKTFFCVSANLSSGTTMVHRDGLLWRAVRASGSIPGIIPPFVVNGEVLVDGGIMNNFPTAVMSGLLRGPVIGVEVTSGTSLSARTSDIEDRSLYWLMRHGRRDMPGILRILVRAGTVNGDVQTVASRAAADLLIQPELGAIDMLSWSALDQSIAAGYRAARDIIHQVEEGLVPAAKFGGFWR